MEEEKKSPDKDQRSARYLFEQKSEILESDLSFDCNEIIQNQKEFFGELGTEKYAGQEQNSK